MAKKHRDQPCDCCRVVTRRDLLRRTELLPRGRWVCEPCEDELVCEDHTLAAQEAFEDTGEERPLCHCQHCAAHRQRAYEAYSRAYQACEVSP